MRFLQLVVPASISALAHAGVCSALGLPTAVTIAGAVLAASGAVIAVAVCSMGGGQPEHQEPTTAQERARTVRAEAQKRFDREEERSRSGGRVA